MKRKNYMHTKFLYYLFWSEKRLLEGRGLFSGNIYTNPAKYTLMSLNNYASSGAILGNLNYSPSARAGSMAHLRGTNKTCIM